MHFCTVLTHLTAIYLLRVAKADEITTSQLAEDLSLPMDVMRTYGKVIRCECWLSRPSSIVKRLAEDDKLLTEPLSAHKGGNKTDMPPSHAADLI